MRGDEPKALTHLSRFRSRVPHMRGDEPGQLALEDNIT